MTQPFIYIDGEIDAEAMTTKWHDAALRGSTTFLAGIPVIQSAWQPPVDPIEQARADGRRIVRHGMKDVLEWLGEEVGPEPGEPVRHAYLMNVGALSEWMRREQRQSVLDANERAYLRESQRHTSRRGRIHGGTEDVCPSADCGPQPTEFVFAKISNVV